MKVYQAINAVQAELAKSGISKDRTNDHDRYQFRGIDDVYNALSPLLAKHGLCILPRILRRESVERQSQKGTALFYVTVEAEFDFVSAEDGSRHTVRTFGEAMDRGDKGTNKAMSAAYKYAAFQAFAIPTEADNDADAHSHEVKPSLGDTHSGPAIVFNTLSKDWQAWLKDFAPTVDNTFEQAGPEAAIAMIEAEGLDNEVRAGLESLLSSKTRSAMKRHTRQKEAA